MQQAAPVRLYGKRGCPSAYAIRDFLHRSDIPFEWIELRDDEHARKELGIQNVDDARLPICIFDDGTRMERPTVRQITEKLGWFRHPSRAEYDLAIYGAGPAGLSASVYGASEGLKTVLVERFAVGGQASTSPRIEHRGCGQFFRTSLVVPCPLRSQGQYRHERRAFERQCL